MEARGYEGGSVQGLGRKRKISAMSSSSHARGQGSAPLPDSPWWVEINGVQEGPVHWKVVEELARAGALKTTDSISPFEIVSWRKVGEVQELAGLAKPIGQQDCGAAWIQQVGSVAGTIKNDSLNERVLRANIIALLWLGPGFAWVLMMLSDWPGLWDGVLIARLSVFGGLALGAASTVVLPELWRTNRFNPSGPTQVLRVLCVGTLSVVLVLVLALGINARDVVKIAFGLDEFEGGSVFPVSGRMIEVRGPLSAGIARKVKIQLDMQPETNRLLLNSEGGWVREGERIGKLVDRLGLDTHSDIECSSACAAAFVHGLRRTLSSDAQLGFHSASGDGTDPVYIELTNEWLAQRLAEIGVSAAFIERAFSTPSSEMWYPSHNELILEGIIHDVVELAER